MVEYTKEDCLRHIRDLEAEIEAHTRQGEYKLAHEKEKRLQEWRKRLQNTKDTAEILRLSGFTVDEEVSPKFKKVMSEFGKGELKSSSGEKVTDPKQAKAIAYSEAGETKDDLSQISKNWSKATIEHIIKNSHVFKPEVVEEAKRLAKEMGLNVKDSDCGEKVYTKGTEDGYKMEDPKEIEAAIKRVKESGHPDPHYLAGLQRALEIAKQERGMKDDTIPLKEIIKNPKDPKIQATLRETYEQIKGGSSKDDDATKEGSIKEYGQGNSHKMEDSDPRVKEAESIINLTGGIK